MSSHLVIIGGWKKVLHDTSGDFDILQRLGLPKAFVEYMVTVSREWSQTTTVTRGVREGDGDLLSTPLFSMVVNCILKRLASEVGYTIRGISKSIRS